MKENSPKEEEKKKDDKILIGNHLIVCSGLGCAR